MNVINKENLRELQKIIKEVIGVVDAESHDGLPYFYKFLRMMNNNIQICVNNQYQDIEELTKYLNEDWKMVCNDKKGITSWNIDRSDCDEMAKVNRMFEKKVVQIDKLLQANLYLTKQWIDSLTIQNMAHNFRSDIQYWNAIKDIMMKEGVATKSKLEGIPDDIWSLGKKSCVASNDAELIKWFQENIPAFFNAKPVDIVKMPYGEDALRAFMMTVHC